MFTYIHLRNFKSFKDVSIDLTDRFGTPKKAILVYGENGIGKSNLASAFLMLGETLRTMNVREIIQSILSDNVDTSDNDNLMQYIRKRMRDFELLIEENKMIGSEEEPMSLEFGFHLDGRSGRYLLETNNSHLIHERLEYVLEKNRGAYFDITPDTFLISSRIAKDKTAYTELKNSCTKFWGKHSFLSIVFHEVDDKADSFIAKQINDNFRKILFFFTRLSCNIDFGKTSERGGIFLPDNILDDYLDGIISEKNEFLLDKSEELVSSFFSFMSKGTKKLYYKRKRDQGKILYHLIHTKTIAGKERDIDFSLESTGNKHLLGLLPYMLVSIEGSEVIIDEFDAGIHDILLRKLLHSLYQHVSGQLIMTTHSTSLMDKDPVIPKDCFYVINETESGNKEIQPITHYDNKIHDNTNIRKQYMSGVYHGIPAPSEIDFTKLLSGIMEPY